jgi:hypothetical protein
MSLYVVPEFNTVDDFNAAFLARQITARSRLIPVLDCDDIDDGDQSIFDADDYYLSDGAISDSRVRYKSHQQ